MDSQVANVHLDSLLVPGELNLENEICRGTHGVVYRATVNGKECVAHKIYRILATKDVLWPLQKFHYKCRILSRLNHPNLVGFVGVQYGRDRNDITLLMEFLHTDLSRFIKENPNTPLSDRIHVLYDVSKGLKYLHSLNPPLIHGDINATNILLTEDLTAKIGDLGKSQFMNTNLTTYPGNLYHMPPESRPDNPSYTTKLDIFSLGVVTIHVVTGKMPDNLRHISSSNPNYFRYRHNGKVELMKRYEYVYEKMGKNHCLQPLVVCCLHDNPEERPTIEVLTPIFQSLCSEHPLQSTLLLQQLMTDESTIKIQYLKTFFIGPPGVGKTLTRLRLCNEMKNMISRGDTKLPDSTLLANCNQVLMCINSESGQNKWITSKSLDDEAQIILRYMCSFEQQKDDHSTEETMLSSLTDSEETMRSELFSRQPVTESIKTIWQESMEKIERGFLKMIWSTAFKLDTDSADFPNDPPRDLPTDSEQTEIDEIMSRFSGLIQSKDFSRLGKSVESSILVNIHDIGGQPGFLEMIPSLISGPAVYLIFINLALPLDQPYKIPFSRDKSNITPFDSMYTVESTISQVLSAISSIDQRQTEAEPSSTFMTNTVATLVGTHLDKLEDGTMSVENHLKLKHQEVKKITDKFPQVVVNPGKDKSFLAIDNFKGTEETDICPLRAHIMHLITNRLDVSIPIRPAWLILSIILRKEFQIVSVSKCFDIGKRINMSVGEIQSALWYLHHIVGSLMHYPDISDEENWFENHIICSPQVIFDSISQIIVASLQLLHSDIPVRECFRKDWIENGLFSHEAINECSKKINNHKDLIPIKKLVKLLKEVNLLSEVQVHNPLPGTPSTLLFMPAILECASIEELKSPHSPGPNHPASVYLTFKCGHVPTGVFCGLVTRITTKGPLKILGEVWELKSYQVKRNKVSFLVSERHIATLISHDTCYEIRIERKGDSTPLHDLCSQVLTTIVYMIKEAYTHLKLNIAFQCPCKKKESIHMCKVSDVAICTSKEEGGPHEVQLREEQRVWIGKSVSIGSEVQMTILKNPPKDVTIYWSKENEILQPESKKLHIQSVNDSHCGAYKIEIKVGEKTTIFMYRYLFKKGAPKTQQISAPAKFESLISRHDLTSYDFDRNVSIDHILSIYVQLENWEEVAPRLGFSRADIERFEYRAMRDLGLVKMHMLQEWHSKGLIDGTATYRVLIEVLLSCGCDRTVEYIFELLKH